MLRQGDVLLIPAEEEPRDGTELAAELRGDRLKYVLAHGEATGHAHSVLADHGVRLVDVKDQTARYLVVRGTGVELQHEEHRPLTLPSGCYRVIRQRTYNAGRDGHPWSHAQD